MTVINITTPVDIVLSAESIAAYKDRYSNISSQDTIIGRCKEFKSINCSNIIGDIFQYLQTSKKLQDSQIDKVLTLWHRELPVFPPEWDSIAEEGSDASKCAAIRVLTDMLGKNLQIKFYLAYVFDQEASSLTDAGSDVTGRLVLTPFEPKDASMATHGIVTAPERKFCDPCIGHYNKNPLSYNFVRPDDEDTQEKIKAIPPGHIRAILYDWSKHGFNRGNPPRNKNNEKINFNIKSKTPSGFDFTYDQDNSYRIGKSKGGAIGLISRYDGFNLWLYTRYYGGNDYSIVLDKEGKKYVGINLGAAFTIEVSTEYVPPKDTTDKLFGGTNIIKVLVTADKGFFIDQTGAKFLKFTGSILDIKRAVKAFKELGVSSNYDKFFEQRGEDFYFDKDILKYPTVMKELQGENIFEKDGSGRYKEYDSIPEKKQSVEIKCCPILPVIPANDHYLTMASGTDKYGKIQFSQLSIDDIQRAQGALYAEGYTPTNPCCLECYYCLTGDLCPGLGEVFNKLRQAEIDMRTQRAKPCRRLPGVAVDCPEESATSTGPQCVAYDFVTGDTVPVSDITGY